MPTLRSISIYLEREERAGVQNQGLNLELHDENSRHYVSYYVDERPMQSMGGADNCLYPKYKLNAYHQNLALRKVPL